MPKIISIEGNIGAGKTTIINDLEEMMFSDKSVVFLREPVDLWEKIKDEKGETILQKFYANPEKYGFAFQVMAFTSRLDMVMRCINDNPDCDVIICERSLEADYHVFAKMLHNTGIIDDISYQVYKGMYDHFTTGNMADAVVYIDADADVCHERMTKRARLGEEGVSLEYLLKCEKYHREWLLAIPEDRILHLHCNADKVTSGIDWLFKIKEFVSHYKPVDISNGTTTMLPLEI